MEYYRTDIIFQNINENDDTITHFEPTCPRKYTRYFRHNIYNLLIKTLPDQ